MKFVLETRLWPYDFQGELLRQKEYYTWLDSGKSPELKTEMVVCTESELKKVLPDGDYKDWCPVGSVEFCVRWFKDVWGLTPLPKNVPDDLIPLCHRKITYMENDPDKIMSTMGDKVFVKDTRTIKSIWNGIKDNRNMMWIFDGSHNPHIHFQVSDLIDDIRSEWRCFVYEGKLVDIKNYAGDPFDIPERDYIEKTLIPAYKSAPVAYILDIAQTDLGTEVIEVHDFYACGLYGFNDPKYPFMLWRWFKEFTKER